LRCGIRTYLWSLITDGVAIETVAACSNWPPLS
jgi:hypothetical protein